jgi:hypothetical protein
MTHFFVLVIVALLPFLSVNADELHLSPIASEKERERILVLADGQVIYFFKDHTIVYLRHPPYESQTWEEWWNDVEHVQPNPQFYFKLTKWNSFHSFQLYHYHWRDNPNSHILESIFSKSKAASEYPYFIENSETGEMTLCQVWSLADLGAFITRYGKEQYDRGYSDGQSTCKN